MPGAAQGATPSTQEGALLPRVGVLLGSGSLFEGQSCGVGEGGGGRTAGELGGWRGKEDRGRKEGGWKDEKEDRRKEGREDGGRKRRKEEEEGRGGYL